MKKEIIKKFDDILNYLINKKIEIDYVELAGDLMRTPFLQKIIEDKGLKISKWILIDECTSIGSALYDSFVHGNFQIKQLKKFDEYDNVNKNESFKGFSIDEKRKINYKIIFHLFEQEKIDSEYNSFIYQKNDLSKLYYDIKVYIKKRGNKEDINKIEEFDKKIRDIDNLNE